MCKGFKCIGRIQSFPGTPITRVAEGSTGILACGSTNTSYMMRSWYKGEHNVYRLPGPEHRLFSQLSCGQVVSHNAHEAMSADNETFAMTFDGASFDDVDDFTCITLNSSGQLEASVIHLYVYSK